MRYGRFKGAMMILLSLLLANFIKSNTVFFLYALTMIPATLMFSELSQKKLPIHHIFLRCILTLLVCYGAALIFFSKGMPYAFLHTHLTSFLKSLPQLIAQNEIAFPQLSQWKAKAELIAGQANIYAAHFIQEQLFAYLVSSLLIMLWLATVILRTLGISVISQDLSQWKTPDHLVWVFIGAFFFAEVTVPFLTPLGKNIFHILLVIYFLQGMAIGSFYFTYKQYTLSQKILSYILLTIFPFLTTCFGFFDLWIDFRKACVKNFKKKESL